MKPQRTESEKIQIAAEFLRKRGYIVERSFSAKELADFLGVSVNHVRTLDIPFVDVSKARGGRGTRRYFSTQVQEWINKRLETA